MNQRQRKQFGSAGNLAIKGTGYMGFNKTSCHRLQQNVQSSATMMSQRSAAHRTMSTSTTTTKTTLRKSGSIGNMRNIVTSSVPSIKTTTSKETRTCPCRQNDLEQSAIHLQEQYARQLQQQIYLLELENNYLKHSTEKGSRKNNENDDSYHSDTSPSLSVTTNLAISREHDSSGIDNPDDENDKEKSWRIRKRVSYAEPEVTETSIPSNSYDMKSSSYTTDQAELLHKLEELYQRERKLEECLKQKTTETERIAYENTQLSDYIEELKAKLQRNEENFARDKCALMEEVVELQRRLDYLTPALADKESLVAKMEIEKDELTDKLRHATNQLQMTIDERNRDERVLFDVEEEKKNEIDRLLKTIRHLENTLKEMENKEASLIDNITSMKRSLREEQLTAKKDKAVAEKALEENSVLIKENSHLSAEITRLEMRIKALNQQIDHTQEKQMKLAENASLKETEKSLKAELLKMEGRLQTEQERNRRTIAELEQYRKAEESARESRGRMQKELDALKVLSESLSNENKSLRHEKFILTERCDELLKKGSSLTDNVTNLTTDVESLKEINLGLHQKMNEVKEISSQKNEIDYLQEHNRDLLKKVKNQENELQKYRERYETIEKRYRETSDELQKQTAMRQEKSEEYDKLAKRVLELSDSVKDKKPTPPGITMRQSKLPTPWPDKSCQHQSSPISEQSATVQQTSKQIQINERRTS
uniref:Uncharacterized protein n=2 Tax=Brugia malayi TaxID=6279 RepID=A0A7I4NM51_BRUMA